jgi:hypothetical protein
MATRPLMTRRQLAGHINDNGIPISLSRLHKLCAPACAEGPEPDAFLGRRPLYSPEKGLQWAKARLRLVCVLVPEAAQ